MPLPHSSRDPAKPPLNASRTPWKRLALEPIGMMVTHLWYEDEDDFQDAIGGPFEDFMRMMPHIQAKERDICVMA